MGLAPANWVSKSPAISRPSRSWPGTDAARVAADRIKALGDRSHPHKQARRRAEMAGRASEIPSESRAGDQLGRISADCWHRRQWSSQRTPVFRPVGGLDPAPPNLENLTHTHFSGSRVQFKLDVPDPGVFRSPIPVSPIPGQLERGIRCQRHSSNHPMWRRP